MKLEERNGKQILTIDGREYTEERLTAIIKRNNRMTIDTGDIECPLCGCNFKENFLFVCDKCGQLYDIDEMCTDHHDSDEKVCIDCCDKCDHSDEIDDDMGEDD